MKGVIINAFGTRIKQRAQYFKASNLLFNDFAALVNTLYANAYNIAYLRLKLTFSSRPT